LQWLTADERAVLCIAELKYMHIPAWAEQAAREDLERAARGEAESASNLSPEEAERSERILKLALAANDRVKELDAEGRLQGMVDSLKAKGVWRDEWYDQEPADEA